MNAVSVRTVDSKVIDHAEVVRISAAKIFGMNVRSTWQELDQEARTRAETAHFNYELWVMQMEDATKLELTELIAMRATA